MTSKRLKTNNYNNISYKFSIAKQLIRYMLSMYIE